MTEVRPFATPQKMASNYLSKRGGPATQDKEKKEQLLPALIGNVKKEKLLITGDDILIEYVSRLMIAVKSIKENMLKAQWIYQLEKFIKHTVWHSSDVRRA